MFHTEDLVVGTHVSPEDMDALSAKAEAHGLFVAESPQGHFTALRASAATLLQSSTHLIHPRTQTMRLDVKVGDDAWSVTAVHSVGDATIPLQKLKAMVPDTWSGNHVCFGRLPHLSDVVLAGRVFGPAWQVCVLSLQFLHLMRDYLIISHNCN